MDNANGSGSSTYPDDPPLARRTVASAMEEALAQGRSASVTPLAPGEAHKPVMYAPYHVHGSVLEGGVPRCSPSPPRRTPKGRAASFIRHSRPRGARGRLCLRRAIDARTKALITHDNPWESIALAAVGGLIVGLLAAR